VRETHIVTVRRSRHFFSAVQTAALQVILVTGQLVVVALFGVDADNINTWRTKQNVN